MIETGKFIDKNHGAKTITKNLSESSISKLKPNKVKKSLGNYDPRIPRKTMEKLCGVSVPTLIKFEAENFIQSTKVRYGSLDLVTYGIEDVEKVINRKERKLKNKEEAEVISVFSQKGGVGKSSFTQHLASTLSIFGKVLVIDLDAQSDATVLFGLENSFSDIYDDEDDLPPTIAELMDWTMKDGSRAGYAEKSIDEVIKTISPNLDIIPADLDLGEINYSLNRLPLMAREDEEGNIIPAELVIIEEVLERLKSKYDYILLDCPPNIETCNVAALYASNRILVPLELEAKSLLVMNRNITFLERLQEFDSSFDWDKILVVPNKYRRENIKTKALAALEAKYLDSDLVTLSEVVVPSSTIIDKCAEKKIPIFVATSRLGISSKSSIPQAKEFTNYFWAIAHEILDIELERLIFDEER